MKKLIILMSSLLLVFTLGSCENTKTSELNVNGEENIEVDGLSAYPHEEVDIAFMKYFFENATNNIYAGNDSIYMIFITLLSYLDAVQNDNIIPEEYEKKGTSTISPSVYYNYNLYNDTIYEELENDNLKLDFYSDLLLTYSPTYDDYINNPITFWDYNELIELYWGEKTNIQTIYSTFETQGEYITFIVESIRNGVPILVEIEHEKLDYTSKFLVYNYTTTELIGWRSSNYTTYNLYVLLNNNYTISGVAQITLEDTKHYCSDNFYIYEEYICGCVYKEKYYFYD